MKASVYLERVHQLGVRLRAEELEQELQALQRIDPSAFFSKTPIQVLRPQLRPELQNGASRNGTGPVPHEVKVAVATRNKNSVAQQRKKTAKWLAWLAAQPGRSATSEQLRAHGVDLRGVQVLITAGHVVKKGDKFTRSSKEFIVNAYEAKLRRDAAKQPPPVVKATPVKPARKPVPQVMRTKLRAKTAAFLQKFDGDEPRMFANKGLGSFVRRGYLVARGDGYVRTAKEYHVNI